MAEEEASDLNLLVALSAELEEAARRKSAKFIEDAVTAAGITYSTYDDLSPASEPPPSPPPPTSPFPKPREVGAVGGA
jgi:hypothetical protein